MHRSHVHVGQKFRQTYRQTIQRKGAMKTLKVLLLCGVICTSTHAEINKTTAKKLEITAKKIRTAKWFYSDDQIKHKIKQSMLTDQEKWQKARHDYKEVVRLLREMNVDVDVPDTLDELLMNRVDKDADKILMNLAQQVKQHIHS